MNPLHIAFLAIIGSAIPGALLLQHVSWIRASSELPQLQAQTRNLEECQTMSRKTVRRWRRNSHPFAIAERIWKNVKYSRCRILNAAYPLRKYEITAWNLHTTRVLVCRICLAWRVPVMALYPHLFRPRLITVPLLTWDGTKNV